MSDLSKEFEYYLDHQDELVEKYNGKVIVIKDQSVIGQYESEIEAVTETSKNHKLGTFLVQKVQPGENGYTQTYHSRVIFNRGSHIGSRES
ncbi:MAG: hypothetical protein PHY31_07105 [Smithellaceae bacterium]|nr:hypothetical protein [Smithellaceae bacterium]